MDVLAKGALVLAATSVLLVILVMVHRAVLAHQERLRAQTERRLAPLAVSMIEGEGNPPAMSEDVANIFVTVLMRYAPKLSGESRQRITEFLERSGYVNRELAGLGDRRVTQRATAAYSLGDMGSLKAAPGLLDALEDDQREVRTEAARSLGKLGVEEAVAPLVDSLAETTMPRSVAAQALLQIGPAAVPRLRILLDSTNGGVRAAATELIGLVGGAVDCAELEARLRDPSAEVRAKAAHTLGRLGAAEAAAGLRLALDDRVPSVRTNAAHALGMIRDKEALAALLTQAKQDRFDPAQAAAGALGLIDAATLERAAGETDAGPHLLEALDMQMVGTS